MVSSLRVRSVNDRPIEPRGRYVLYWMTSARRVRWSFALDHAIDRSRKLGRPLVIFEPLRLDYPHASDRLHRFVVEGMAGHAQELRSGPAFYYPWIERRPGEGRGLLSALAEQACLVVADDYPAFFLPRMLQAAAARLPIRVEAVDGNGLLPLGASDRAFPTAYAFRRFLQKRLPDVIDDWPRPEPFADDLPALEGASLAPVEQRWPAVRPAELEDPDRLVASLPIDHGVAPAPIPGGGAAGAERLRRFVWNRLGTYAEDRNHPDEDATSGLSPYLHFGHVGAHQVLAEIVGREDWDPGRLSPETSGKRAGWWGMGESAEAFLDQLVTWRELGFNQCWHRTDYAAYESLPDWARRTLAEHAGDRRAHLYDLDQLAAGETHDPIWNAAQHELRAEGRLHNYLRMLWGKRILEWTPEPRAALAAMIALNDRFALDGRDPNSYTGILWCLGRHDRPWGPERPIFGKVRYMSSANTARKLRLREYLYRHGSGEGLTGELF